MNTNNPIKKFAVISDIYNNEAEYINFVEAIKAKLLTFFDRVKYHDDHQTRSHQLGFIGEIGEGPQFIAQQTFFAEEYLEYFRSGTLDDNLTVALDLTRHQMSHSNPALFKKLYGGNG